MISHKYKFLSIRIPKTASTSVSETLRPYYDIYYEEDTESPYYHHRTTKEMKPHFEKMKWNFDDYFKFAFVRNPFAREVSFWKFYRQYKIIEKEEYVKEKFSDYVKLPKEHTYLGYVSDYDGTMLADYVGRVENLQEDFNIICDKIGIPHQKLPHINKTKHKHYTEYYDDETKQIVAEKYANDIEYFGYEFGE